MLLTIQHTTTKKVYEFEVSDVCDSRIFYHFNITIPEDAPLGEYRYTLFDDETKITDGLMQIGEYKRETTTYNKKNTIVQYGE